MFVDAVQGEASAMPKGSMQLVVPHEVGAKATTS